MSGREARVYPVARTLAVLDRLLEPWDVRPNVHIVEPGHHGGEQQQRAAVEPQKPAGLSNGGDKRGRPREDSSYSPLLEARPVLVRDA